MQLSDSRTTNYTIRQLISSRFLLKKVIEVIFYGFPAGICFLTHRAQLSTRGMDLVHKSTAHTVLYNTASQTKRSQLQMKQLFT